MPNWVYNYVVITGNKEDLLEFMDKARKPHASYFRGGFEEGEAGAKIYNPDLVRESVWDEVLSFWNFKRPKDTATYFSTDSVKPEGYEDMTFDERMAHSLSYSSDGWYDWNVREWGTKWDATDVELEQYLKNKTIVYRFTTAWSPPEGAFQAMIEQHPRLHFKFECEEEQGWGVEYESFNGNLSVVKEWDIPSSHADYVERDNEDGCVCNWEEDRDEWFDDCHKYEEAK